MKLYVYKTVKSDVINVEFVSKDLHSVHWDITTPPPPLPLPTQKHHLLSLPSPFSSPLNLYWFFGNRIFHEPT